MLEPLRPPTSPADDHPLSKAAAVAELGQAALTGLDVHELLDRACAVLCDALDVEFAKVLHQPDTDQCLVMRAGRGWDEHIVVGETVVPCGPDSQAGYTLIANGTVIVDDLATEQRFRGPALLEEHGIVSGMSVLIPDESRPYGVLGVHTRSRRTFTLDDGDFLRLVANVIGGAVQNARARTQVRLHAAAQARRVRFEAALAKCANALLASSGDRRLEQALEALLSATRASVVFVERNVHDAERGLCTVPVVHAAHPGPSGDLLNDDARPWAEMSACRSALESGTPCRLVSGRRAVRSELRVPVLVDGRWVGLVGLSQDDEREWEPEDVALLETAGRMIGAFWEREEAEARLQAVIRSKDDLVTAVSHELRTPLTVVLGLAAELADGTAPLHAGEMEELMHSIVAQSRDMAFLIEDLLVSARAGTGDVRIVHEPVDLASECRELARLVGVSEGFECRVNGESMAWADPTRVRQIIRNLMTNAHRHGGPTIAADVSVDEAGAVLTVRDDGGGVPGADRDRIFRPYERGYDRRGVPQSIGIGLTVSRQLAHMMGGELDYDYLDGWSHFTLRLPAARANGSVPA